MDSNNSEPVGNKRRIVSILLAAAALVAFVAISWLVWDNLRQNVWVYYTDEGNTSVGVDEDKARFVLWEEPVQNVFTEEADPLNPDGVDAVNQEGDRLEATFSPNGTTMILVRRDNNETGSDMYLSQWDGRVWSRPEAIVALNSDSNDRGPAFSRDGEYLYFASDREGGKGGYDLYVSHHNAEGWSAAESLGLVRETCRENGAALLLVSHDRKVLGQFDNVRDLADINRAAAGPSAGEAKP